MGYGKWGVKVYNSIKNSFYIKYIITSKSKLSIIKNVDWVIILSPNETHYKIVKYFISKKINVFCEKPLTLSSNKTKKLIDLSKKNNTKLIVSEIELFKKKNIKLKKFNNVLRLQNSKDYSNIEYRLLYHDVYIFYEYLKKKKFKIMKYYRNKNQLTFSIKQNSTINFNYIIKSNLNKKYLINNINMRLKGNFIKKMIINSLNYNYLQIRQNHKRALFCNWFIEKLKLQNKN